VQIDTHETDCTAETRPNAGARMSERRCDGRIRSVGDRGARLVRGTALSVRVRPGAPKWSARFPRIQIAVLGRRGRHQQTQRLDPRPRRRRRRHPSERIDIVEIGRTSTQSHAQRPLPAAECRMLTPAGSTHWNSPAGVTEVVFSVADNQRRREARALEQCGSAVDLGEARRLSRRRPRSLWCERCATDGPRRARTMRHRRPSTSSPGKGAGPGSPRLTATIDGRPRPGPQNCREGRRAPAVRRGATTQRPVDGRSPVDGQRVGRAVAWCTAGG